MEKPYGEGLASHTDPESCVVSRKAGREALTDFFMQLIVVHFSAAVKYPFQLKLTIIGIVIHISCVGLPIALMVGKYSVTR
jgi:hypothetical protein